MLPVISHFNRVFLKGLVALLPLTITAAMLFWLAGLAERHLGAVFRMILPQGWYRSGMGVVTAILVIACVGLLMEFWVFRFVGIWLENLFFRIPLVKTVYGALRELILFLSGGKGKAGKEVVSLNLGFAGARVIGFVTHENPKPFIEPGQDMVAVYLPMSYQIGGYTVIVPRSNLRPVDMPLEEATRFILTGGIGGRKKSDASLQNKAKRDEHG